MACIMKSMKIWDSSIKKASIWMPVSIRKNPYVGFGNGSSRVRVYDHTNESDSLTDFAQNVREQVNWNRLNGTWYVPNNKLLVNFLNLWPLRLIMKKILTRKSLDYGTTIFSHMEWLEDDKELNSIMEDVEVVNLLHDKIPISMFAIGFGGKTNFTISYDGALFSKDSINSIFFGIIFVPNKTSKFLKSHFVAITS